MTPQFDIVLRYCGSYGWLGILMKDDVEVYRTGIHHKRKEMAIRRVGEWIAKNHIDIANVLTDCNADQSS